MATNNIDQIEQAVSDALTYFAVIANNVNGNAPSERSEFARKAGDWVIEASEKLSGYVNTEKHARRNRERYELAKAAVHSKRPSPGFFNRQHSVEYDKLLENIKEELNEPAKLTADVKSLYEKQDDLMMELAEMDLISDNEASGEEIDNKNHVAQVLRHISTINYTLINGAQIAFMKGVSRQMANGYSDAAFITSVQSYGNELNKATMASMAAFTATAEVLANGKKVTKQEFLDIREKYSQEFNAKIGSIVNQIEESIKKANTADVEKQGYDGPMFG